MRRLLEALLRGAGGILFAGLGASAVVFGLVIAAGVDPSALPCAGLEPGATTSQVWLDGLSRLASGGEGWSCRPIGETLEQARSSVAMAGLAVGMSVLLAIGLVWWEGEEAGEGSRTGSAAWLMAPPVLWAALITALTNAVVTAGGAAAGLERTAWLFPMAPEGMRRAAAVAALVLGGGTLWSVRSGLRADLEHLRRQEFMAVARANGGDERGRLLRNLAVPLAIRLAGRLPLLLGEVIVVEYVFTLDGVGRELLVMLERRDAPALMAVTAFFVAVTMALRAAVGVLEAWLHPMLREEGA